MHKKKLLILDDEPHICDLLMQGLVDDFEVTSTQDMDTAYRTAVKTPPDIMLIDICLKDGDGIELCDKLRKNQITKKIPILLLTGHGNTETMLRTYDVGADDYIEKPVNITIIRNRLNARLARNQELTNEGDTFGNLKIYPERFEIELDGKINKLSEIEFELLRIFLVNANKKISRQQILTTVWNDVKVSERTIDVHVSALRKKLKNFDYSIQSLYGSGYILRSQAGSKSK